MTNSDRYCSSIPSVFNSKVVERVRQAVIEAATAPAWREKITFL
ncbi:hypothetical protein ABET52_00210 [Saccharococcus caldoxylosilyticus]|uniref:NADP-dependent malic enzyme n=1 Tax=Saccharococcus caldoxylosilyticus TaxID=81408 RepID=A0A150LQA2_9BACL|nr:hypothetical protein [Parageobacillus caldoxylosilyticus]KYD14465.1 NADP-dependent malic enzyme [Parageobacillus caldoxylosilyticus]